MADTRVQLEAADWVRMGWLSRKYGQPFHGERLRLTAGGVFDFDDVSADGTIVANISTSSGTITSGKNPAAKLQKLRADMFFLLMTQVARKLIVLTERDMYEVCQKEKQSGRVPAEIEFIHVELPETLSRSLREAKAIAVKEMSRDR